MADLSNHFVTIVNSVVLFISSSMGGIKSMQIIMRYSDKCYKSSVSLELLNETILQPLEVGV
jgi:hypothetical protein